MLTNNQARAQAVRERWLNKSMTCVYNDRRRTGIVRFVKQGPAVEQNNGEYFYMNEPNGKVYIDFHQDDGKIRCFLWAKVVDPREADGGWYDQPKSRRIIEVAEELGLPVSLVVKRPRTIE